AVQPPLVLGLEATTRDRDSLAEEFRACTPWVEELPAHLSPVERSGTVVALARAHGVGVVLLADPSPECLAVRAALRRHVPQIRAVRRVGGTGLPPYGERAEGDADILVLPRAPSPGGPRAGVERDRVRVIGFGIDGAPFDPAGIGEARRLRARQRSGVPPGAALVVFLGRMIARKRPHDVLALACRFRPEAARFRMVGEGPLALAIDREIERCSLSQVRRVAADPDVPALLAASDALVLPSEREGLPRVLLEAQAAGKPVVAATASGLVEDTLALTGGGVVVGRVADIDGLEQGLRRVLAEPPEPEAVRRAVGEHFDVKRMAAAYGELLWPR
ncbi:MAG TPA: glycosyltransferase family 4 protein, partial [Vicinamibacteria bacterium]